MKISEPLKDDVPRLAALMGIALAIGIYLIVTCVVISRDGVFYVSQAQRLADDPLAVARRYPIGYPFLLSVGHRAMGLIRDGDSALAWVYSSQSVTLLTRVLALIPLYFLGKSLVGGRHSFAALLILIFLPHGAHYGSNALREWPFLLMLSVGFWLLIRTIQTGQWPLLGLVGLSAGLGYLIRPMCGQLLIYGGLALIVAFQAAGRKSARRFLGAGLLLAIGFAVPVVPVWAWAGDAIPHQLRPALRNNAPVIVSVGGQSSSHEPLQFEVSAGERLDLTIEAHDEDNDDLTFSVVSVPTGARAVHRLESAVNGAAFWTISEREKDALLETYGPGVWDYDCIAYYAYARGDAADGLEPVYRFWSPVRNRHFYALGNPMAEGLLGDSDAWQKEGVAFYAFGQQAHPEGTIPVFRFKTEAGQYTWGTGPADEADGIAWYAQIGTEPPAGSTLRDRTFQWRPEPGQSGQYQLNFIVSDGKQPSIQLVLIRVGRTPASAGAAQPNGRTSDRISVTADASRSQRADVLQVPLVLMGITKAMFESLRVVFVLPLCLGFCHRFKHEADRSERVLMIAVVVVNVGLMLGRSLWIEPGTGRRYCLALVALTIFYIPSGLELMVAWSRRRWPNVRNWPWFHILLLGGIALCVPRLLTPIGHTDRGYLVAARWLEENTTEDQVVAVPDTRISFYAARQAVAYEYQPDPRRADLIVTISGRDVTEHAPKDWRQVYTAAVGRKERRTLRIYRGPLDQRNEP